MSEPPDTFLRGLHLSIWLVWIAYWTFSALGVKPAVRKETPAQRWSHGLPFLIAGLFFVFPRHFPGLSHPVYNETYPIFWLGTGLLIAGLLFTVWARMVLGRNWSGNVTVKENHELIQIGPYRWVRHPIYTGLLAGFLGSAIAQDRWGSFCAVALIFVAFWIKLRREEAWMHETFGEKYAAYCARTKRLVPFVF